MTRSCPDFWATGSFSESPANGDDAGLEVHIANLERPHLALAEASEHSQCDRDAQPPIGLVEHRLDLLGRRRARQSGWWWLGELGHRFERARLHRGGQERAEQVHGPARLDAAFPENCHERSHLGAVISSTCL